MPRDTSLHHSLSHETSWASFRGLSRQPSLESMDVDDWLKTIEKKLHVVQCSNRERVLFASHQLEGPASEWWDTYVNAYEARDFGNF
jgi:hypothetical protein